jgi:hypothetical protein
MFVLKLLVNAVFPDRVQALVELRQKVRRIGIILRHEQIDIGHVEGLADG